MVGKYGDNQPAAVLDEPAKWQAAGPSPERTDTLCKAHIFRMSQCASVCGITTWRASALLKWLAKSKPLRSATLRSMFRALHDSVTETCGMKLLLRVVDLENAVGDHTPTWRAHGSRVAESLVSRTGVLIEDLRFGGTCLPSASLRYALES